MIPHTKEFIDLYDNFTIKHILYRKTVTPRIEHIQLTSECALLLESVGCTDIVLDNIWVRENYVSLVHDVYLNKVLFLIFKFGEF
jgi:alpha-glucuronidase